jgi:hypothetical protein
MQTRRWLALLLIGVGAIGAGLIVRAFLGGLEPIADDSDRALRQFIAQSAIFAALGVEYLIANWVFKRKHPEQSLYDWIRKSFEG